MDFWEWILDVKHLVVNFGSLEVDFRLGGEFRLPGLDFRALKVHNEPPEANIWSLRVNFGPLGVHDGHIGVKIEPLGVNF